MTKHPPMLALPLGILRISVTSAVLLAGAATASGQSAGDESPGFLVGLFLTLAPRRPRPHLAPPRGGAAGSRPARRCWRRSRRSGLQVAAPPANRSICPP